MITKKSGQIGQGANARVYLGEFMENDLLYPVALKEFDWNSEDKIERTLEKYDKIKKMGIPTLDFCKNAKFDGESYLVMEHVNLNSDYLYVSYNTEVNGKKSNAETSRKEQKLNDILNFREFLERTKEEIAEYTSKNVSLYFDTYFFGSQLSESSELTYKIIDLDNVEFFHYYEEENLVKNLSNFKDAILGFVECFVSADCREKYVDLINQTIWCNVNPDE